MADVCETRHHLCVALLGGRGTPSSTSPAAATDNVADAQKHSAGKHHISHALRAASCTLPCITQRSPVNSGPISLAAEVKVESSVDRDWVMNIRFTMLNTAVPVQKCYMTTYQYRHAHLEGSSCIVAGFCDNQPAPGHSPKNRATSEGCPAAKPANMLSSTLRRHTPGLS